MGDGLVAKQRGMRGDANGSPSPDPRLRAGHPLPRGERGGPRHRASERPRPKNLMFATYPRCRAHRHTPSIPAASRGRCRNGFRQRGRGAAPAVGLTQARASGGLCKRVSPRGPCAAKPATRTRTRRRVSRPSGTTTGPPLEGLSGVRWWKRQTGPPKMRDAEDRNRRAWDAGKPAFSSSVR
jgi:hypothetical protein